MDTATAAAPPALGLRELAAKLEEHRGFAEVLASLEAGHGGTLGGVWGSSRALVAAALAPSCPGPLVIVCPHAADIDTLVDDLSLFTDLSVVRFPAWESEPGERLVHDEIYGDRLRVLKGLGDCPLFSTRVATPRTDADREKGTVPLAMGVGSAEGDSPLFAAHDHWRGTAEWRKKGTVPIIVTSIQSLLQPVPAQSALTGATREIRIGAQIDEQELARWLVEHGCHATTAVELPGEFSVRGGILDVFPPDAEYPVRIELFGDEVESIRTFDIGTQRSVATLQATGITMLKPSESDRAHFTSYLPRETWFLLVEPAELEEEGKFYLERMDRPQAFHGVRTTLTEVYKFPSVTASGVPAGSLETTAHLEFESVEQFSGEIGKVRDELERATDGQQVFLVCDTEAEIERLQTVFADTTLVEGGRLHFVLGRLHDGFRFVPQQIVLISAAELFHRHEVARTARRRTGRAIDSFLELREGDLVVHVAHGIGRYRGLKLLDKDGRQEEHLELEYFGGTKIYVPGAKIELVQKYVGGTKAKAVLARIGGKAWVRQKEAAQRAVTDLAADMLELQARRDSRPGIAFPPDTEWQREFDAAFPYQETRDQLTAIRDIKRDMIDARPMDRLLCGDVGFGKTELAIRAAFKAVDAGYQVAVLVPTTVLAEQHRRTFSERMAEFPFEISALSRFCTAKEQGEIVRRAADGSLDILIGTHRLASPDVQFANLGLLIIDEEQRFGVEVKERLKAIRSTVDVLTMTATPIPRTLHMSLLGARSISNLETPPEDRLAVETRVTRFNEELVRHAIVRELNRDGQAFFVHNRVHDIQNVAARLAEIVPEARIEIGHGQMPESQLEEVMFRFVRHEFDILLATTIIESGLDIPNANTIFIDDADRYGLADLHQLRGRVGRYKHRAYCYLLVDENRHLSPEAARRLRAIEEFSHMGAGFSLAMRDLELRGAGNILGTQQSGHIATVGYEMYCAMLEKSVRMLKNLPPRETVDVNIDLPGEAYFPRTYVPDMRSKIDLYRRLARVTTEDEVDDFAAELADRFGPVPDASLHVIDLARLRIWAHRWGIRDIHLEDHYAVFTYTSREKLASLLARAQGRLRVADRTSAYLPLGSAVGNSQGTYNAVKTLLRPA
jgi:transcription-repair coupling factor (superfamily II helicase)